MRASRLVRAFLPALAAVWPTIAPAATESEMGAVLKRQEETVEKDRRKLEQSIRENENDRKRIMMREQRRQQRELARPVRPPR